MITHLRANLWLLVLTVLLCSVLYPLLLLGIGQTVFPDKAQGSLLTDAKGNPVGSRLIAQPFSQDQFFQPRPSAASYNAAASGASNLSGSNYQLRDQVARRLGPIVKYQGGPKVGQLVAPDVESWFQKDQFDGKAGIVAQWANLHNASAQNWIKNDMSGSAYGLNGKYVAEWQKSHKAEVDAEIARLDAWKKDNPDKPAPDPDKAWVKAWIAALSDPSAEPKPEDLAVSFFISFSEDHPGMFPSAVEHKAADGKTEKVVGPVKDGSDIQSAFFDMWLQEHPDADLEPVPADMVTSSGSGLDPDITLSNARWQLNSRVAAAWAKKTGRSEQDLRGEIEKLLQEKSAAPLGGLVGVPLVNVLEVNLALQERFEK